MSVLRTGLVITLFILNLGSSAIAAPGSLNGKVNFKGNAPKNEPVKMNADPVCAKENAGKTVLKNDILVNSNKTLANVFVYVKEGLKGDVPAAPAEAVTFDQSACTYHPRIFGIRVNQPLKIINSDPTLHNVHSVAKANSGFNIGMPTKGQTLERKFAKPELGIKIKCDVHNWMVATAYVMEHPYFAVTDDKGAFTIPNLPAGEYTIEAIHEKLGAKTQKIKVADGKPSTVDFTYTATATN